MIRTYFDEMYDAGGQVRPHGVCPLAVRNA
jgi:hypothetical protein